MFNKPSFRIVFRSGLMYFTIIIFFSLIYWLAWLTNPECFVLSSEVNFKQLYQINNLNHNFTATSSGLIGSLVDSIYEDSRKLLLIHSKIQTIDQSIYNVNQRPDDILSELNRRELLLQKKLLNAQMQELLHKWRSINNFHKEHLNYFDFLYFSIITATTTGYGDIVPNSTMIRVLVSIQILLSLIAFGIFITLISFAVQKQGEKHSPV